MKKVLIVDDSFDDLNLLENLLLEKGFRVLTASSGQEALLVLQVEKVDLVVTDLNMPDGDGLWLIEALKTSYPDLKSIIVTAETDVTEEELLQRGASGFLRKPYIFINMIKTIQRLIRS